MGL
ncbi:Protein of unknown function [Bacillus wiedmannii]|jgi:hypothetical protein